MGDVFGSLAPPASGVDPASAQQPPPLPPNILSKLIATIAGQPHQASDAPSTGQLLAQDGGQALINGLLNGARTWGNGAAAAIQGKAPPAPIVGTTPNQYVAQNTPDTSSFAPPTSNFAAATRDLNLNPQEQALYQRHLSNMFGPGGVDNANGSRSSLYQTTVQNPDTGKFHNVPTVWNGKIEANFDPSGKFSGLNQQGLANVKAAGLNSFPAYDSEDEAEDRYTKMHEYMDKDAAQLFAARTGQARFADWPRSNNIEDRRNDKPVDTQTWPRPDGEPLQMPNVFDLGHGTMSALNPNTDFIPQPSQPSNLSRALGILSIPSN